MFVKLTEADGKTNGNIQWGPGIRHEARKKKGRLTPKDLCSPYVIHYYSSRYLAILLNPIHANFKRPLAWEFIPEGETCTDGLKHGSQAGTTTKRIRLPRYSIEQRVAFGIFCAKTTCENAAWNNWADAWLSGEDRTAEAAWAAAVTAAMAATATDAAEPLNLDALALKAYKWRDPLQGERKGE